MSTQVSNSSPHPGTKTPVPKPFDPKADQDRKDKRLTVDGYFGPKTIARLNEYLGVDAQDLTDETWLALAKKLGLYSFTHTTRETRILQRYLGYRVGTVDGVWYDKDSKQYGSKTTEKIQSFLNGHL